MTAPVSAKTAILAESLEAYADCDEEFDILRFVSISLTYRNLLRSVTTVDRKLTHSSASSAGAYNESGVIAYLLAS